MRISWHGIDTASEELLELEIGADGVRATSTVDAEGVVHRYEALLGGDWVFHSLVATADGREVRLARSASGVWTVDGTPRPDLAAAVDIDLSFSPFTNTLPIRRLPWNGDPSHDIVTAYLTRELEVLPDPQRYTRLSEHHYLYESRDSDFRREITVDADGLVIDHPGLFRRR